MATMPIYLIKSILSIPLALLVLFAMFTMFEIFGRSERRFDAERLRRLHSAGGMLYIILFAVISYLCIQSMSRIRVELSPRANIHALLASTIVVLFFIKSVFIHIYRQFYSQAKLLGLAIAVLSLLMIGSSAGYYLLASAEMTEAPKAKPSATSSIWVIRTDAESIRRGEQLYRQKCILCHDPLSTGTIVGPGQKGILKGQTLPVLDVPATPENIARQLRHPKGNMPSFAYLSDEEILDLIAYLNTL